MKIREDLRYKENEEVFILKKRYPLLFKKVEELHRHVLSLKAIHFILDRNDVELKDDELYNYIWFIC